MRILLLNQFFPPDPAPTGVLLAELGQALAERGHEVRFVSAGQDYHAAGKNRRRVVREAKALGRILLKGLREPRPDVVLSCSSPPSLLVAASMIARRHGAVSVHWAMDLYPELAVALGEISRGALASTVRAAMRTGYRQARIVVGLDEDMAGVLKSHGVSAETIRPWVPEPLLAASETDVQPEIDPVWLYSGNLGRAHEWETLLAAQSLLEKDGAPWRLRFQGGGGEWSACEQRVRELGLRRCERLDYVEPAALRDSLLKARVLIVTQRPEARGLLWPSKLAMLLGMPRFILFVGPPDGAIARDLRSLPHAGVFAPGEAAAVAAWLRQIETMPLPAAAVDPAAHRRDSLNRWIGLVEGCR